MYCPCGSKQIYPLCCGNYIDGNLGPKTPEQLMRSRYTAYTQAKISYIVKTMLKIAAENFDPIEATRWAKRVKWLDLTILQTSAVKHDQGTVEFRARYQTKNKIETIHEISKFEYINGYWYYIGT